MKPIPILKVVSESDAAPALLPAYKLFCASGSNPPIELPAILAKFVAVTTPTTFNPPAVILTSSVKVVIPTTFNPPPVILTP